MVENEKIPVKVYQIDVSRFDDDDLDLFVRTATDKIKNEGVVLVQIEYC